MPSNKLHYPTPQTIWNGRKSDSLQYWHQAVKCTEELRVPDVSKKTKIAILGYSGDEGVKRNHGRTGTVNGPDTIRKLMAGMAYHLANDTEIYDLGNLIIKDGEMETSHIQISKTISELLQNRYFPVLLGGGHDLAFAHVKGIFTHLQSKGEKLGIINLDAHFDLRQLVDGKGHSGSPFYQLACDFPRDFNYFCLGIQRAANPPSLFETARKLKCQWIEMEDFTLNNWDSIALALDEFCSKVNKIYLSIDLDGFSSAYAPGVSAPSPMGFSPELSFKVLEWLAKSGKLISMDVVELNPEYDQDHATARLAARCVEFILRKRV